MTEARRARLLIAVTALTLATPCLADVTLPQIFTDNMMLQRDMPVAIWGTADVGEKVTVEFAGQSVSAAAGKAGRWRVTLKPMAADGEAHTLSVRGTNAIEIKNVILGEIWICSGQSNMVRGLGVDASKPKAYDLPNVRLFGVQPDGTPQLGRFNKTMGWKPCNVANLKAVGPMIGTQNRNFAEVGFVFGKKVHKELNVPVGLIQSAVGGSAVRSWIPDEAIEKDLPIGERLRGFSHAPGGCYRLMIQYLVPFTVRGVIWYQGEDDGKNPDYDRDMTRWIAAWRKLWANPTMPFYFTQICPTNYRGGRMQWLWEDQIAVMHTVPHTALAVTNDVPSFMYPEAQWSKAGTGTMAKRGPGLALCGGGNPHPKNKHIIGERLANIALVRTYGQKDRVLFGPMLDSHKRTGDKIVITMKYVGSGLATRDKAAPAWFLFDPSDLKYDHSYRHYTANKCVVAPAQITGKNTITVTIPPEAKNAKYLTFAWHCEARHNLMNVEGLPAVSFRIKLAK